MAVVACVSCGSAASQKVTCVCGKVYPQCRSPECAERVRAKRLRCRKCHPRCGVCGERLVDKTVCPQCSYRMGFGKHKGE